METHLEAERYYNYLQAKEQRQKNDRIKEKTKSLYLNALLIVPNIILEQCEAILNTLDETDIYFPSGGGELPF
jgi:hypothetical protein